MPRPSSTATGFGQRSFDDLGTPLHEVTFCVLDLETTGGSPTDDRICEIGAVKVHGGACQGTFHTLVDPGRDIPPAITVLTGLTTALVSPAPRIEAVLPSLSEFIGDTVFVGHNVRFDRSFVDAALLRADREPLSNVTVDTCALARRLVRDEVPNCKLGTLADRFRLDHKPSHRALDDALATADLLHVLLERAAAYGVLGLDDLLALPSMSAHPQAAKLPLTNDLPRTPGVYLFRDGTGRVLYIGKATDLRSRVRSYFSSDTRRKVAGLLRETARIDHITTPTPLDAAVTEVRLIHEHLPRYNRQFTNWHRAAYLKLTDEAFPRLSVVKRRRDDDATYLGPLPSSRVAKQVALAVESSLPIRRCTADPAKQTRAAPCAAAQLGVSTCPCAGAISEDEYGVIADQVRRALTDEPHAVIDPLEARMERLADAERYEEAADIRDRLSSFVEAHERVRGLRRVAAAGRLVVRLNDRRVVFEAGRLTVSEPADTPSLLGADTGGERSTPSVGPEDVDELRVVDTWLRRHAHRLVLEECDGELATALPRLPDVRPRKPSAARSRATP